MPVGGAISLLSGLGDPGYPGYKLGTSGPWIADMQKRLVSAGYSFPRHGTDGNFGSETDSVVRQFQRDKGLTLKDGIVGQLTFAEIQKYEPADYVAPAEKPSVASTILKPFRSVTGTVVNSAGTLTQLTEWNWGAIAAAAGGVLAIGLGLVISLRKNGKKSVRRTTRKRARGARRAASSVRRRRRGR